MEHAPYSHGKSAPPGPAKPVPTADGSYTLMFANGREHYHSLHGAVAESRHIFIQHGLLATRRKQVNVLEVGLGTGLNTLMTWEACCRHGLNVDYLALEPHPLPLQVVEGLAHPKALEQPELDQGFKVMMGAAPDQQVVLTGGFSFRWLKQGVHQLERSEAFDLVYFDAFAPDIQPDLWTEEVFRKVHRAMLPGAILVTYCVKGDVRRAMQAVGLVVERLPGPPGKNQMLRAMRPTV